MALGLQEITGCIGLPVAGNPTQYVMEKAYAQAGLEWRYLTMEVSADALSDAVRGMKALGFHGYNCTEPHRSAVIPLLDGTTDAARQIGAVNCVFRDGEKMIGDNTDGKGFVESLRTLVDPTEKRVVLLGAGGAARAIAVELGLAKIGHLTVVNRSAERGSSLVSLVQNQLGIAAELVEWHGEFSIAPEANIVINSTSIGQLDGAARVPVVAGTFHAGQIVADIAYNPVHTRLLKEARDHGATTLDGLGMLVNQARHSFKIWTGIEPDMDLMRDALEEYLGV